MFTWITKPPDKLHVQRIPLDTMKPKDITINRPNVDHIDFFNDGTVPVYISIMEGVKLEDRITFDAADTKSIPICTGTIFAAPSAVTDPLGAFEVTTYYYSDELMKEIRAENKQFLKEILIEVLDNFLEKLLTRLPGFRRGF